MPPNQTLRGVPLRCITTPFHESGKQAQRIKNTANSEVSRGFNRLFNDFVIHDFATSGLGGKVALIERHLMSAPGRPVLLDKFDDVDRPEGIPSKISVIIPTLNEAGTISQTLDKLNDGFDVEGIMVDDGSTDRIETCVCEKISCT